MSRKTLLKFIPVAICAIAIFAAATVSATEVCRRPRNIVTKLQVDWPASPLSNYKLAPNTSLAELVKYFFEWGVGLGGLGVFIALIIAGVQYITSVADPTRLNDAKDRIKSSLIGLVLLLSSWAIFQIINPSIGLMQKKLPDMIKNSGLVTTKTCTVGPVDCCTMVDPACDPNTQPQVDPACDPTATACDLTPCPQVPDSNCVAKNWLCCQANDTNCLKGKTAREFPNSAATKFAASQDTCVSDMDCDKWYCKCDESTWTKKCAENDKVCVMTVNQPELGCNVVRFYKNSMPDPATAATITPWDPATKTGDYKDVVLQDASLLNISGGNTGWIDIEFDAQAPKAFEALSYAKDSTGAALYIDASGRPTSDVSQAALDSAGHPKQMEIHCGVTGCGCTVNTCLAANAGSASCNDDQSQGGEEYAYNEVIDGNITVFQVKDQTKTVGKKAVNALTSVAYTAWDNSVAGQLWNWWMDH